MFEKEKCNVYEPKNKKPLDPEHSFYSHVNSCTCINTFFIQGDKC